MMADTEMPQKIELCSVCASRAIHVHQQVEDIVLYRCDGCELIWAPEVSPETISSFYNREYFHSSSRTGYQNYLADEHNHRRNAINILHLISGIRNISGTRILDIGCGYGFFLDEARRRACAKVSGVEICREACQYARKTLGLHVVNDSFDASHFPENSFDVIFLMGTIEHLIDPAKTLRDVQRLLTPQGLVVITTINTSGFPPLYSLKPPEHLFYFNASNFTLMLEKCGYRVVLNRRYWAYYSAFNLLYLLGRFFRMDVLCWMSTTFTAWAKTSLRIPTNEMIVVAQKASSPTGSTHPDLGSTM